MNEIMMKVSAVMKKKATTTFKMKLKFHVMLSQVVDS